MSRCSPKCARTGDTATLTSVHNEYPNKDLFLTEQSVTLRPHSQSIDIAQPVDGVHLGRQSR
ncbi:MAG: hypothetical protein WBD06_12415, partial [Acidobacteriaceae bacterium]